MTESCRTCIFWAVLPNPGVGECHRYPPHFAVPPLNELAPRFGWMRADDWCGEHRERSGPPREARV